MGDYNYFFFVMSINHDNLGFDAPIFFFND